MSDTILQYILKQPNALSNFEDMQPHRKDNLSILFDNILARQQYLTSTM